MRNYYRLESASKLRFKRKKSKKPLLLLLFFVLLGLGYLSLGSETFPGIAVLKKSLLPDPSSQKQQKEADNNSILTVFKPIPEDFFSSNSWHKGPLASTHEKSLRIANGDTLIDLLQKAGLSNSKAHTLINTLEEVYNPRKLRQGQEVIVAFVEKKGHQIFQGMNIKLDVDKEVRVIREKDNEFFAREITRELQTRPALTEAKIKSSLYQSALDAELPLQVLIQIMQAYSYNVDFQRDIRPGDSIEVMYEERIDEKGQVLKAGSALFARLQTRGKRMPIYRYETPDGKVDFYNSQGKSVRKTLMVTPIDGARLSSNYGMRKHPILGYNKMHRGLDFAASSGTPIMAAGDGIVEYAGRKGSYGNYIRIRHPNQYHTVYAHLRSYAKGIKRGARVKQGETIGYVGSTGRSTGPHLHYEVKHRGQHMNPTKVKTPPGRTLEGDELQQFLLAKQELEQRYASLREETHLAKGKEQDSAEVTKQ
ncbi:MAG: M23 family metallopeptidase [Desulfohalobiaceae bacterium]